MVYTFFDKKTVTEMSINENLAEELHKPVIKNLKRTVDARFKDNIWIICAVDLAEMWLLSSFNCGIGSSLEIKIPDASTLIETNKSNIDKQNFEKYCRYWE